MEVREWQVRVWQWDIGEGGKLMCSALICSVFVFDRFCRFFVFVGVLVIMDSFGVSFMVWVVCGFLVMLDIVCYVGYVGYFGF